MSEIGMAIYMLIVMGVNNLDKGLNVLRNKGGKKDARRPGLCSSSSTSSSSCSSVTNKLCTAVSGSSLRGGYDISVTGSINPLRGRALTAVEGKELANNLEVLRAGCISGSVSISPRSLSGCFPVAINRALSFVSFSSLAFSQSELFGQAKSFCLQTQEESDHELFAPADTDAGRITLRYTWSIVPCKRLGCAENPHDDVPGENEDRDIRHPD